MYGHFGGVVDMVRHATGNPCFPVGLPANRTIDTAVLSLIHGVASGPGAGDIGGRWVGTDTRSQGLTGRELDLTPVPNGGLT